MVFYLKTGYTNYNNIINNKTNLWQKEIQHLVLGINQDVLIKRKRDSKQKDKCYQKKHYERNELNICDLYTNFLIN